MRLFCCFPVKQSLDSLSAKTLLTLDLKYYEKTHCKYKVYLLNTQEFVITFIANLLLFVLKLTLCADSHCYYINNRSILTLESRFEIRILYEICRGWNPECRIMLPLFPHVAWRRVSA